MLNAVVGTAGTRSEVGLIAAADGNIVVVYIAGEDMDEERNLHRQQPHIHGLAVGSYDRRQGQHSPWLIRVCGLVYWSCGHALDALAGGWLLRVWLQRTV